MFAAASLRVAKTDSTGQFALVSDGTSPASPVIADGAAVYTPGLSERRNGASLFRHDDLLGSLRFLTDSSETVQANRLFSGFGATVVSSGAAWETFGWLGDAGDQTDADTGLVLMGHRLYDSRLGRFLSQDPAGDGDNWYAYCHNSPINATDPTGLSQGLPWETGAPDRRYGGVAGNDGGGIFGGGTGGLDQFFQSENASMERGHQGYMQAEQDAANEKDAQKLAFFMMARLYWSDPIASGGLSFSVSVGNHRYVISIGFAADTVTRQLEGTFTIGHYRGFGAGASLSPYVGLGLGSLNGYNGYSSGYHLLGGPYGSIGYDYNSGYKGITYGLPGPGFEAGAFMGVPNGSKATRGGSYTFATNPMTIPLNYALGR